MGKKRLYLMLCIALFFSSTVIENINIVTAADTAAISVEPPAIVDDTIGIGDTFNVSITISNVTNLGGYEFNLNYSTSVLTTSTAYVTIVTDWFSPGGIKIWQKKVDDTLGYVRLIVTLPLGTIIGVDGSGIVATIMFTVDDYGTTILDLNDTKLGDPFAEPISHEASDGFFTNNPQTHDVAVVHVKTNVTVPIYSGQAVNITVVVENQGDYFETFAVAALNETDMAAPAQAVNNLPPRKNQTLYFIWNTTGVAEGTYTIKGMADTVTGETDVDDNIMEDGTVTISLVPVHDIAITTVTPSSNTIHKGETMSITVVVRNEGTVAENCTVTATYYNVTFAEIIDEPQNVTDLESGAEQTLTFTWDTTGVAEGVYTISANATVLLDEIDTDDNVKEDGTVTVGPPVSHDLAVSDVSVSPDTVKVGETVLITVTVKNEGNVAESSFYVIARYDSSEFARVMISSLEPGEEISQPFNVDTTFIVPDTYTVKGEVSTVAGETDTADNTMEDGTLTLLPVVHDIAVTNVTVSSNTVTVGQTVSINVTVKNEGTETETFDVTTHYNETNIDTQTVSGLASGAEKELMFTWDTTGVAEGVYTISANATVLLDEIDTDDNVKEDGTVTIVHIAVHDIAVTNVTVSSNTVTVGQTVSINVTVKNEGTETETFNVEVRYDDTEIDTQTVADLAAGVEQTLTFTWDTAGVAAGTYTVEAEVSAVAGETDTADNVKEGGTVTVQEALAPELLYGAAVIILVVVAIIVYFILTRARKSKRAG